MPLICSCTHKRIDHESGKLLSDIHVSKCSIINCTCTKYHNSKESQLLFTNYYFKMAGGLAILILIGLGTGLAVAMVIDEIFKDYDLVKIETGLNYFNSTSENVKDKTVYYKDSLPNSIKAIFGLMILVIIMITATTLIGDGYDRYKRKLINE